MTRLRLIAYAAACLSLVGFGWWINGERWALKLASAVEGQKAADKAECLKDKRITEGVSHGYQDQIAALDARVAALRLRPARCVVPVAGAPGGRDAAAGPGEHVGQDGIADTALYDYATEAETYRLQLVACQRFVGETWEEKGR